MSVVLMVVQSVAQWVVRLVVESVVHLVAPYCTERVGFPKNGKH